MLLSKRFLRVVPNPFAVALDHEGRPCAAVQYDPEHSAFVRYIGAARVEEVTEKRKARPDRVRISWTFDLAPVDIEDTGHHRALIAGGELLAADAETAKRAGLKTLVDPMARLRDACAERIAEWQRDHDGALPESLPIWFAGEAPLVAGWPAPDGSPLWKERKARAETEKQAAAKAKEEAAKKVAPKPAALADDALSALGLAAPPKSVPPAALARAGGDVP